MRPRHPEPTNRLPYIREAQRPARLWQAAQSHLARGHPPAVLRAVWRRLSRSDPAVRRQNAPLLFYPSSHCHRPPPEVYAASLANVEHGVWTSLPARFQQLYAKLR